jgi:hypothetical protein
LPEEEGNMLRKIGILALAVTALATFAAPPALAAPEPTVQTRASAFLALQGAPLAAPAVPQALPTPVPSLNPVDWFVEPGSMGVIVMFLINFIRANLWTGLDGRWVILASFLLSLTLAFWGHAQGYLQTNWVQFGVFAALTASGLADTLKKLRGGGASRAPLGSGPVPDVGFDRAKF